MSTVGIGALQANVTNGLRRASVPLAQDGFTAGGQVGYNYQFTPGSGIVVGLEADAAYTDLNRRRTESIFLPAFNPNRLTNTYRRISASSARCGAGSATPSTGSSSTAPAASPMAT